MSENQKAHADMKEVNLLRPLTLAGVAETGLVIAEGLAGTYLPFLPLGGTHLTQIGALLGMSVIAIELRRRTR